MQQLQLKKLQRAQQLRKQSVIPSKLPSHCPVNPDEMETQLMDFGPLATLDPVADKHIAVFEAGQLVGCWLKYWVQPILPWVLYGNM